MSEDAVGVEGGKAWSQFAGSVSPDGVRYSDAEGGSAPPDVLADLLANLSELVKVGGDSLGGWIYDHLLGTWLSPINASLAYAIGFVLVCLFFMWLLYRRRIFIKI